MNELIDYKMDNYFRDMKLNALIRKYPTYRETIEHYKKRIKEVEEQVKIPEKTNGTYSKRIILGRNEYVSIDWDIETLKNLTRMVDKKELSAAALKKAVDANKIDERKLKSALSNNEPIMILHHEPESQYFCADGNHRILSRVQYCEENNIDDLSIETYLFPAQLHMAAMKNELHVTIYQVLCNLAMIRRYYRNNQFKHMSLEEFENQCLFEI